MLTRPIGHCTHSELIVQFSVGKPYHRNTNALQKIKRALLEIKTALLDIKTTLLEITTALLELTTELQENKN